MLFIFSHDFIDNLVVFCLVLYLFPFTRNFVANRHFFLPLINHHVSIFYLFSHVGHTDFPSKSLLRHLFNIKISHCSIIKLIPFTCDSVLDYRVVMSTVGMSYMYHKTFQYIVEILVIELLLLFNSLWCLLFSQKLSGVLAKI